MDFPGLIFPPMLRPVGGDLEAKDTRNAAALFACSLTSKCLGISEDPHAAVRVEAE